MFEKLKILQNVVEQNAQRVVYQVNQDTITYEEMWKRASALAEALQREGTSPVVIYGHQSASMLVSIIACWLANRAYVPVDVFSPKERVQKIVQISKATLLIQNEDIAVDCCRVMTIEEILQQFQEGEKQDTNQNQIAYLIFTSGSTGEPKGVPILYENLENFVEWIGHVIPNEKQEKLKILHKASYSFDLSVADVCYALWQGHTLVALGDDVQKNNEALCPFLQKEKIHVMVITPTFGKVLLMEDAFCEKHLPDLSCIYFCGETLEVATAQKIMERFPALKMINAYGPTEATSAVSSVLVTQEMLQKDFLPVGKMEDTAVEMKIDQEEIVLKGKSVFAGYWNVTSDCCYQENGVNCFRTGDFGKIENGLIYCYGRMDQQVKYKGYRIELGEIESQLLRVDGVREAVVVAKYKENTNIVRLLKAYLCLEKQVTIEEVKANLMKVLPRYMIPKSFVIVEKLPVNANGKYDRKRLSR